MTCTDKRCVYLSYKKNTLLTLQNDFLISPQNIVINHGNISLKYLILYLTEIFLLYCDYFNF